MRPANGDSRRRAVELCVPLGTFETADVKGRPPRLSPDRGPGPGVVLPILPHDAVERAAAVEAIAVEIVRQVGPVVALTVAAALDEAVADAAE